MRYHLPALNREETGKYLAHRLEIAGTDEFPFTPEAVDRIFERSNGIPRLINVLADRALLAAFVRTSRVVEEVMIDEAYEDLEGVRV